jgi:malonate decarboxylase delta subunit
METFTKAFPSKPLRASKDRQWALAGVVGSGNLEVMFERKARSSDEMECHVETSIPGFRSSWLAALADFASHYPVGGTKVTIHDQGAAPVLVNLRLRQAYDHLIKAKT